MGVVSRVNRWSTAVGALAGAVAASVAFPPAGSGELVQPVPGGGRALCVRATGTPDGVALTGPLTRGRYPVELLRGVTSGPPAS
ncbi:MAG: hypothetical protein JWR63_2382, partial [Conexibacter sp.]|nr:hypothetical protein [Conexibacter sp.]